MQKRLSKVRISSKCTRKVRIRVIFEHLVEKQPSKVRIWYKSSSKVRIWDKIVPGVFRRTGLGLGLWARAVGCGLWARAAGWGSGCGLPNVQLQMVT